MQASPLDIFYGVVKTNSKYVAKRELIQSWSDNYHYSDMVVDTPAASNLIPAKDAIEQAEPVDRESLVIWLILSRVK